MFTHAEAIGILSDAFAVVHKDDSVFRVPAGYFSTGEYAKAHGVNVRTAQTRMLKLFEEGKIDRVMVRSGVIKAQAYYRPR